jgi:transposase
MRVYIDESGVDDRLYRQYGRAPRGEQVPGNISGKKTERISLIAGLNQNQWIAPLRFDGSCNTEVVNAWAENCLAPCLKAGQVVIWDNASFHKASRMKKIVEAKGARLLPLPTYSPDLNPIENYWAVTKARLRKHKTPDIPLSEAIDFVFRKYQ